MLARTRTDTTRCRDVAGLCYSCSRMTELPTTFGKYYLTEKLATGIEAFAKDLDI